MSSRSPGYRLLVFLLLCIPATPSILHAQSGGEDCSAFYSKEHVNELAIDKKPVLKIIDNGKYSFTIVYQDCYKIRKKIGIYKNTTGLNLKSFIKPGFLIRKAKDDPYLAVVEVFNNQMNVNRFLLSCEE